MHRFGKILLVLEHIDAGDAALARAAALAQDSGAALTIALPLQEFGRDWPLDNLRRVIVEGLTGKLEQLADPIRDTGVAVDVRLLFGRPFLEIILQVLRGSHDIVIKTAGGGRRIGATLFGSTDMHLLRKCPCPLWLIRGERTNRPGGVLAAVAPDADDPGRQRLASSVLDLGLAIAQRQRAPLHVVHAWQPPVDATLVAAPWLQIPAAQAQVLAEQERQRHEHSLTELMRSFSLDHQDVRRHLVEGRAEDVLLQVIAEEQIDVIVMATLARGGIPGLFIGDTAETVLGQVDCSVLAIKPEGFISPITQ